MFKIFIITALLAVFIFLILRRFGLLNSSPPDTSIQSRDWVELHVDSSTIKRIIKKTLSTVGIGLLLLILTLVIATKIKIALIALPISFYLIGQYFMVLNQISAIKKQRFFFHTNGNDFKIIKQQGNTYGYNLNTDIRRVREVKAVQKNNGILLGYYELITVNSPIHIPFILAENLQNKRFFDQLARFPREIESKLFPVI